MEPRAPVLLVLLVDVQRLRWLAAGVGLDGEVLPLVASEDGDLEPYLALPFDEQVSFLRHRLSGVLQRGCDRLWARAKKPCQIVLIASGMLDETAGPLTDRVADHFVEWMSNPPIVFFVCPAGFFPRSLPSLEKLAGDLQPDRQQLLVSRLAELFEAVAEPGRWEQIPKKAYSKLVP
jgi:hypothetical protein